MLLAYSSRIPDSKLPWYVSRPSCPPCKVVGVVTSVRPWSPHRRRACSIRPRPIPRYPSPYRGLTSWTRLHHAARALQQISPTLVALWACCTPLNFWPPTVVATSCCVSPAGASLCVPFRECSGFLLSLCRCSLLRLLFPQRLCRFFPLLLLFPELCENLLHLPLPLSPFFLLPFSLSPLSLSCLSLSKFSLAHILA